MTDMSNRQSRMHEALQRLFRSHRKPELSAEFNDRLADALRATRAPAPPGVLRPVLRRWIVRAYWLVAVVVAGRFIETPALEAPQFVIVAGGFLALILVSQRALRPSSLREVLRTALFGRMA